ncbi:hypothetical protein [Kushneria indalinina]|uniref:Uncharacterized protein n=1 Tax=Kushneria indalinina DSM 14324 TaxID=1122140 RepID=A0A3D9DRH9_9GAMM|nr:hypothetical protein [Kushneria indalinina]REC93338.1 hypothetical protein C8D72_3497 [Kushneria indalinina DSM 14324]
MESVSLYNIDSDVSPQSLLPHAQGWLPPTGHEIKHVLDRLRVRQCQAYTLADIADLIGLAGSSELQLCIEDRESIGYGPWAILCCEAGYGCIWKDHEQILAERLLDR